MIPGRETFEFERVDATRLAERARGRTLTPREVSDYWLERATAFIKSDPVAWLKLTWQKWRLTWNRYEIPDTESYYLYRDASPLTAALGRVLHFGVLCPLAVAGVVLTWSRRRELWVLHAVGLLWAGSVTAFYVFGRYRYPLVPVLIVFAAAGIEGVISRIQRRKKGGVALALSCAAGCGLWVNLPANPEAKLNAGQLGNLGAVLAANGRLDEAIDRFEEAVELHPSAPRLRQFLADALSLENRHAEAIAHYRTLLELDPARPNAAFNYAVALEATGRFDEALLYYRRAAALSDDEAARRAVERLGRRR